MPKGKHAQSATKVNIFQDSDGNYYIAKPTNVPGKKKVVPVTPATFTVEKYSKPRSKVSVVPQSDNVVQSELPPRNFKETTLSPGIFIKTHKSGSKFIDSNTRFCVRYTNEEIVSHFAKVNDDLRGDGQWTLYMYPLIVPDTTEKTGNSFADFQEAVSNYREANDEQRPTALATGKKYFLRFPPPKVQERFEHNGHYVVPLLLNVNLLNDENNPSTVEDMITQLNQDLNQFGVKIDGHHMVYTQTESTPDVVETTQTESTPDVVETTQTESTPDVVETTQTESTPNIVETTQTESTPDVIETT